MASIDFQLHKIFVEGETDQNCIAKILELRHEIQFPYNGFKIGDAIIDCKGWTNLKNNKILIDPFRIDNNGKNLIIFDADNIHKDGGYKKRYSELMDIAKILKVKFEVFLFPDNESDGTIEDLIITCFRKEMRFFEQCWNNMLFCFEQNNTFGLNLNTPIAKEKIYSYSDLFEHCKKDKNELKKNKSNNFDSGLWEFNFENNININKLISFIDSHLL